MRISRRGAVGLMAAAALAACSGVMPYADRGTLNLDVELVARETGAWTRRGVFLDIWTGPKGPGMEYLGTVELDGGESVGLPLDQPLHLALAFEEKSGLGAYTGVSMIELPMRALRPGELWRLRVAYRATGFEHDLARIR